MQLGSINGHICEPCSSDGHATRTAAVADDAAERMPHHSHDHQEFRHHQQQGLLVVANSGSRRLISTIAEYAACSKVVLIARVLEDYTHWSCLV